MQLLCTGQPAWRIATADICFTCIALLRQLLLLPSHTLQLQIEAADCIGKASRCEMCLRLVVCYSEFDSVDEYPLTSRLL